MFYLLKVKPCLLCHCAFYANQSGVHILILFNMILSSFLTYFLFILTVKPYQFTPFRSLGLVEVGIGVSERSLLCSQGCIYSINNRVKTAVQQSSVSRDPSEIIPICWFDAQEIFIIIINCWNQLLTFTFDTFNVSLLKIFLNKQTKNFLTSNCWMDLYL